MSGFIGVSSATLIQRVAIIFAKIFMTSVSLKFQLRVFYTSWSSKNRTKSK